MTDVLSALRSALQAGGLCALLCDHDAAEPMLPVWNVRVGPPFAGRARTVAALEGGLDAVRAAVRDLAADDVLVVAAGRDGAVLGDNLAAAAAARGAVGAVVDGYVRDLAALGAGGTGVRARGTFPRRAAAAGAAARDAARAVDADVEVAGIRVAAGDVIVADADGVVAVPAGRLADVARELPGWLEAEADAARSRAEPGIR